MKIDDNKLFALRNAVINCETENEAKELLEYLYSKYGRYAYFIHDTKWNEFEETTCYDPYCTDYDSIASFVFNSRTIVKFKDILSNDYITANDIIDIMERIINE